MNICRSLATVGAAGTLAVGSLGVAAPAQAQAPVVTGGLVNVTIVDAVDVNDVVVQVPIAAAVNICDTTVAVLVADLQDGDGEANCDATATSNANRGGSR